MNEYLSRLEQTIIDKPTEYDVATIELLRDLCKRVEDLETKLRKLSARPGNW